MTYKWTLIPVVFLLVIGIGFAYGEIGPLESGPDLTFNQTGAAFFPSHPHIDDEVKIHAYITNIGDMQSDDYLVSIYDWAEGKYISSTWESPLDSGETRTTEVFHNFSFGGTHTIMFKINSTNETNQSNNVIYRYLDIMIDMPDITFYPPEISIDPENPIVGKANNITVHIINNGTAKATNFSVRFLVDGTPVGSVKVDELLPNETKDKFVFGTFATPGPRQIQVYLDHGDVIIESNEENNYAYKDIVVQEESGPDLTFYPPEVSFDPSSPLVGQSVDVTAYIINIGDADANGISIYSGVIQPDGQSYGIFNYLNLSEILGPNQKMTKTFSFTPNMTGIHTVYVAVNTTNQTDINQSNNVARKNITVKEAPPKCSGNIKLTFAPNPVRKGGFVFTTISGLNNCDGKTVYVKGYNLNRTCIVSGTGCFFVFRAPTMRAGLFLYRAMIDKNDDGDFRDPGELDLEGLNVLGWGWGTYKNVTVNRSSIGSTTSTLPSLPGY